MFTLPSKYPHMFNKQTRIDEIHVNNHDDNLHVKIKGISPNSKADLTREELEKKMQTTLDLFQDHLKQSLNTSVTVELEFIPVEILRVSSSGEHLDPVEYEDPQELDEEINSNPEIEHENK